MEWDAIRISWLKASVSDILVARRKHANRLPRTPPRKAALARISILTAALREDNLSFRSILMIFRRGMSYLGGAFSRFREITQPKTIRKAGALKRIPKSGAPEA